MAPGEPVCPSRMVNRIQTFSKPGVNWWVMQRRTLLAGSSAVLAGLAGCSGILGSSEDGSDDGPVKWETSTDGDASVTVNDPQSADLRVYKCNTATARKSLGERSGDLRVAFEYTFEAEQWYEDARVVIVEDGNERRLTSATDAAVNVTDHGSVSGSVDVTVPVDGSVAVAFRLVPSPHCSAGDHADTYFRVRDVTIETV